MQGGVRVQGVRADEAVGLAGGQAAEVGHGHGHFGTGDVVRVIFEVHTQVTDRNLIHKRLGNSEAHLQPLGGPLRLLAAQVQGVELRGVKARLEQVEAVALPAAGQGEQLLGAHRHVVRLRARRAAQRREAVVQAVAVRGAAARRRAARQSWRGEDRALSPGRLRRGAGPALATARPRPPYLSGPRQ